MKTIVKKWEMFRNFWNTIQVIAKDRFSKKSSAGVETLRSEVAILQSISHRGIIKLESMFETKDKIFVVMEKMNGDMLEMILSQVCREVLSDINL